MSWVTLFLLGCLGIPILAIVMLTLVMGPRYVGGLWSVLQMMRSGLDTNPSRVTLVPADGNVWRLKGQVQKLCSQLQQAGFTPVGVWTVREIPPLAIAGLIDEERRTFAAVYDMAVVGVWADLFCLHDDGTGLTVTNAKIGWGMDQQPDREKAGRSGASIAEILHILDTHRDASSRIPVVGEEFAAIFEAEYAREQDWRIARGGPTPAEVGRTAEEAGMPADDQAVEEVIRSTAEQNLPEIARACIANHLAEAPLDADERRALEPRLVAVHDRMSREQALELFASLVGEAARELESHPVYLAMEDDWELLTPREIFSRLANALPHPAFPKLDGRVAMPVEADVYRIVRDQGGASA